MSEWQENLPENVREWDEVKNSDSPEKFWDQIVNMRSLVGRSIQIPTENAKPEDHTAFHEKLLARVPGLIKTPDYENEESVNTFYNALGRPEKAEDYKIPEIDNKGVKIQEDKIKELMPIAHKYGLSQKQFDGLVSDITAADIDLAIQQHAKLQEDVTKLKNDWGLAYEANLEKIKNIISRTGAPKQLQDAIEAGHIDFATANWLLGIANSFKGEGTNLSGDRSSENLLTPEVAKQEVNDIMANKEHPYWDVTHPGHEDAKKRMRELYRMAYPDGATKSANAALQPPTIGVGGVQFT